MKTHFCHVHLRHNEDYIIQHATDFNTTTYIIILAEFQILIQKVADGGDTVNLQYHNLFTGFSRRGYVSFVHYYFIGSSRVWLRQNEITTEMDDTVSKKSILWG